MHLLSSWSWLWNIRHVLLSRKFYWCGTWPVRQFNASEDTIWPYPDNSFGSVLRNKRLEKFNIAYNIICESTLSPKTNSKTHKETPARTMQSYKTLSSDIFTPSTNGHWSTLGTTGHYTAYRIVIPVQSAHVPRLSHQSVLATIIDNPSIDDGKPVQPRVPVSE